MMVLLCDELERFSRFIYVYSTYVIVLGSMESRNSNPTAANPVSWRCTENILPSHQDITGGERWVTVAKLVCLFWQTLSLYAASYT